ncbi:hypothetical protein GQ53DRAFT_673807 [Thozetella sp. PMI_491]|nr:hypothetical protein GQ53DRAFT_673807 [Thozetella sp. PMI_491]
MSFGVGLGDIAILLKGLSKVISALKSEAVDGFRRYKKTYRRFIRLVEGLTTLVQSSSLQKDPDIKRAFRNTQRLLRHYFSRIAEFEPHLGSGRVKKSLLGAIAKIKWTQHTKMLADLRQDLDRELGVLYLLVATKPR